MEHHISCYCDLAKFEKLFAQFKAETPLCPWNKTAAEGLSMPEERRSELLQSYINGRDHYIRTRSLMYGSDCMF